MCGIFAAWLRSGVSAEQVQRATREMQHRGPDGAGCWISSDRQVGLGHRRLSIIGVDNGQQPIGNEDDSIQLVVNGEFYGFESIRRELEQAGHRFRTESDSELALHLYEELELDFVCRLRGEFSLVVWDGRQRRLIAVRDRFGVKPLFYAQTPAGVFIASEAKALFAAGVPREWDVESFFDAASMQYVLPDRTVFRGVRQVPPGCLLTVDNGNVEVQRYWDIPGSPDDSTALDSERELDLIEQCRHHVVDAISARLRSDVPVCFQLSGGLDSSVVLGTAAAHSSHPVDAYTVTFGDADYDEGRFARDVARAHNVALHSVEVSPIEVIRSLPEAVRLSEGLCINGHLSAKFLLHRRIHADGYKVVLTGEGADEAFAGYGHLRCDHWRSIARDDLINDMAATNRTSLGMMLTHGDGLVLDGVQRRLGFVPEWMAAKATYGHRVHQLLNRDFLAEFRNRDPYGELVDSVCSDRRRNGSVVDRSTRLWSRSALANYILGTLGDGTEMAHSVEGRVPFLDHQLWDFLRNVPLDMKIRDRTEKHILREAMREFVPDSIYRREKHPFDAPPVTVAGDTECQSEVDDVLHSTAFEQQPFFDPTCTRQRFEQLQQADRTTQQAWDPVIMTVLSAVAIQQTILGSVQNS